MWRHRRPSRQSDDVTRTLHRPGQLRERATVPVSSHWAATGERSPHRSCMCRHTQRVSFQRRLLHEAGTGEGGGGGVSHEYRITFAHEKLRILSPRSQWQLGFAMKLT